MLVNLTPHVLNIIVGDETLNLQPSGTVARVATKEETVGLAPSTECSHCGGFGEIEAPEMGSQGSYKCECSGMSIPIVKTSFGEVEGLPEPQKGTYYVVSRLVLTASRRGDLLAPGQLVRNKEGQPIGCKGLSR
jgi:hypothetical protein